MFTSKFKNFIQETWKYQTTHDKQAVLHDNPHYTDHRFDQEQTIFGAEKSGLNYDYSDRFWQWDYDKAKRSAATASASEAPHTAAWYERYLSEFFGKPVELCHIIAGVNKSNGYSYLVFGYKDK